MKKLPFKIVLALLIIFLALIAELSAPVSLQNQILILIASLIVTGIPHGAVDHLVEQKNALLTHKKFSFVQFLGQYVITIFVYVSFWAVSPEFSLMLFLLISAWHFGETDMPLLGFQKTVGNSIKFLWGVLVLAFLLLNHPQEVIIIIHKIIPLQSSQIADITILAENKWIIFSCLLSALLFLFCWVLKGQLLLIAYKLVLPLIVVFAVSQLPLILGFTLYFTFWHSLLAFKAISKYILPENNFREAFKIVWFKALPFTGIAFLFMALCYVVWYQKYAQSDPTMFIFIFISTITLPHLVVMHNMNSKVVLAPHGQ